MGDFTNGQWAFEKIDNRTFIDAPSFTIAELRSRSSLKEHQDETLANARLIAAAPDMHEALKLYTAHQQGTRGHYCSECHNEIDKALAKAEGKV